VSGRILAVCVARAGVLEVPGRRPVRSAIDTQPVDGRVPVALLGLAGDVQVNKKFHGGEGQAVYAYGQEDADRWAAELERDLPPGRFGENLRTAGLDLTAAVIGERWRAGTALLEVTAPRTPCAKLQAYWDVPQLMKRFTDRGASGAYLRVVETGDLGAGDAVEVVSRPDHGVTVGLAFRAFTTEGSLLAGLAPVIDVLPGRNRSRIIAAVDAAAQCSQGA
jgi:MOSC domain-containing protein YiiM